MSVGEEPAAERTRPGTGREAAIRAARETAGRAPKPEATAGQRAPEQCPPNPPAPEAAEDESLAEWRDRALRLQAEIDNFRKRQKRLAEERIREDRERLLRAFLSVSDDLERALESDGTDAARLREGVDLTRQGLMRLLDQEGVEPIIALGEPFDPEYHEGVATIPHERVGVEPNTVAKVVETGYRYEGRLLRPARVIVAA